MADFYCEPLDERSCGRKQKILSFRQQLTETVDIEVHRLGKVVLCPRMFGEEVPADVPLTLQFLESLSALIHNLSEEVEVLRLDRDRLFGQVNLLAADLVDTRSQLEKELVKEPKKVVVVDKKRKETFMAGLAMGRRQK